MNFATTLSEARIFPSLTGVALLTTAFYTFYEYYHPLWR